MNYTVDWSEAALDGLASVWVAAADQAAVAAASYKLEQDLAFDPYARGFERNS